MINNNKNMQISGVEGQQESYIYNILHDINKLKILLVFTNKGFSWHRELKSLGFHNFLIEETLNEFNNLGFIELRELSDLDDIHYEALKSIKYDMQHYFKIYFSTIILHKTIDKFQNDLGYLITKNPQLQQFINIVQGKLKPFMSKTAEIMQEETTQLTRMVNFGGVYFEKDTIMSKEVKQFLQLSSTKSGQNLIIRDIKPLALMTKREKNKYLNNVFLNGDEVNPNIFNEIKEKDKLAEDDFKDGSIGKSETIVDIEREHQDKDVFDLLGINNK